MAKARARVLDPPHAENPPGLQLGLVLVLWLMSTVRLGIKIGIG